MKQPSSSDDGGTLATMKRPHDLTFGKSIVGDGDEKADDLQKNDAELKDKRV